MNQYLPYYISGGFFLVVLIATWVRMLIGRNMVWKKVSIKIDELCVKEIELEASWEKFDFERIMMKQIIGYVPPGEEEKAKQSRTLVREKLNSLCKNRRRRKILHVVFSPFFLSLSSRKPENLKKLFHKFLILERKTDEAILNIKKLYKSSVYLTEKDDKERRASFEKKLHERDVKKKQRHLSELMSNLSLMIDYVAKRQQKKSIEVDEPGIDRGLEILDFEKAKENWEEEIRKIREMEGEDLLDIAIEKCEDLSAVFKIKKDKSEDLLAPVEYGALKIKEKIDVFNFQVGVLTKMQDALNVERECPDTAVKAKKLLFEDVPKSWNQLDLDGLEKNLEDANDFLENLIEDNQFLNRWANSILSQERTIKWLEGMKDKVNDLHSIKINAPKGWHLAKKKLKNDMRESWLNLNGLELEKLNDEINQVIDNHQQRLATKILDRAEELELKSNTPKETIKRLMDFSQEILKGSEESQDSALSFGQGPELGKQKKFVHTSRGVRAVLVQGSESKSQRSTTSGLLESEERFLKSLRDTYTQS